MKRVVLIFFVILMLFSMYSVYANETQNVESFGDQGEIVQIKEKLGKEIEDYKASYGESYAFPAFILNKIRVYSIPFCFIGIAIGAIFQYVIGIRKLDVRDRGFMLIIGFITILVICQVLPLIFAIVVKGWRG